MPDLPAHSSLATTTLSCSIFSSTYSKRKDLLHHLRFFLDEIHKTFRYDASAFANASELLALGVFPCPLACGVLFDRGSTYTSRALDTHIARGTCRTHLIGRLPLPRTSNKPKPYLHVWRLKLHLSALFSPYFHLHTVTWVSTGTLSLRYSTDPIIVP